MTSIMTSPVVWPNVLMNVPTPDPLGYPVPAWILQGLSYLTLTLHLSAVQFTVGAALLLLWARLRRRSGHDSAAHFFGSGLPLGVSYLITLGIPPLLFVQVLYGQLFYSSSVLMGAFWIQVIPAVMLAYAGFYYHKLRRETKPRLQLPVVAASAALLLYVGFIYVNNLTLSMSPGKWMALYAQSPGGGVLGHGEPTAHPRYLLFMASSFGVAGLALIWRGVLLRQWGHDDAGRSSQAFGWKAFRVTWALWIIAGIGLYATRPQDMRAMLSTQNAAAVLLGVGLVAAVLSGICAYFARNRPRLLYPLLSSAALLVVTACMVIFRDLVRIRELAPHWDSSTIPVNGQWGMLALFVVSLVAGVALLAVMAMKVLPGMAESARERLERSALVAGPSTAARAEA